MLGHRIHRRWWMKINSWTSYEESIHPGKTYQRWCMLCASYRLPKTNIDPENGWLKMNSFWEGLFSEVMLVSGRVFISTSRLPTSFWCTESVSCIHFHLLRNHTVFRLWGSTVSHNQKSTKDTPSSIKAQVDHSDLFGAGQRAGDQMAGHPALTSTVDYSSNLRQPVSSHMQNPSKSPFKRCRKTSQKTASKKGIDFNNYSHTYQLPSLS